MRKAPFQMMLCGRPVAAAIGRSVCQILDADHLAVFIQTVDNRCTGAQFPLEDLFRCQLFQFHDQRTQELPWAATMTRVPSMTRGRISAR